MSKVGHIIWGFRWLLGVKKFFGEPIPKFKRGDVIVEIGCTLKYVVLDKYRGQSRSVYTLKPISYCGSFNWLGHAQANIEMDMVEGRAVKLGTYDFKKKSVVEDVE